MKEVIDTVSVALANGDTENVGNVVMQEVNRTLLSAGVDEVWADKIDNLLWRRGHYWTSTNGQKPVGNIPCCYNIGNTIHKGPRLLHLQQGIGKSGKLLFR